MYETRINLNSFEYIVRPHRPPQRQNNEDVASFHLMLQTPFHRGRLTPDNVQTLLGNRRSVQTLLRNPRHTQTSLKDRSRTQNQDTMICTKVSFLPNLLGMLVFLICLGICCYQVFDRVSLYLSEPTTVDYIITRNESILFPAISFCVPSGKHYNVLETYIRTRLNNKIKDDDDVWKLPFNDHGLDLNQLWYENKINASAITVTIKNELSTSFDGVKASFPIIRTPFQSAYGTCYTFTADKMLELKGRTYIDVEIDQEYIYPQGYNRGYYTSLYYKFHSYGVNQMHASVGYTDKSMDSSRTEVKLKIMKFFYQNKKRFQCIDEHEADAQGKKCIDEAMQQAKLPCRYPFIDSRKDLKQCATLKEVHTSMLLLYRVYDDPSIVQCQEKKPLCSETIYSFPTPNTEVLKDRQYSYFKVIIPDTFEMVTESFTYSVPALLSDVGGSLGLFLGWSVISCFDSLRKLLHKMVKH